MARAMKSSATALTQLDTGPSKEVVEEHGEERQASRGLIFAIVSMALFMASVDATIVATALPTLHRDLHSPLNWSGWTITAYQLGQIIAMPVAGKVSDQFGRKKVFLSCAVLFTVSSLLCGLSSSIYMLVALRVVQALGGGAFMPSATGIVADRFGKDRDRAIGMFTSIFPLGGIIGPVLGGVFVAYWSWRGIFFINVPVGVVLIALGLRYIPKSHPREAGHIDVTGVVMLATLILASMYGITTLGNGNASIIDPRVFLSLLVAVGLGVAFVRHAKHANAPFIPLRLLTGKGFAVMNVINLSYGACAMGFGSLIPLYAQDRYHVAVLQSGTLLTARAIGSILIAGAASMMLRKTGYRLPMVAGFLIIMAGLIMMWLPPPGVSPYLWLALSAGLTGLGMGCSAPASNNATLQLAPDQIAAIAGLRGSFRQMGAIISISITTAIIARSGQPGIAQAHVFLVFAAMLIAMIPLVYLVPEHKGSW
jgi:EmrB/QacA subfamily drug resistance transporter